VLKVSTVSPDTSRDSDMTPSQYVLKVSTVSPDTSRDSDTTD